MCLALISEFWFDLECIINNFEQVSDTLKDLIKKTIQLYNLDNIETFEYYYGAYNDIDYIYYIDTCILMEYSYILSNKQINTIKNIYNEGFCINWIEQL